MVDISETLNTTIKTLFLYFSIVITTLNG